MQEAFEDKIKKTIEQGHLLDNSKPILVAISGGADSVALLSALVALGYQCVAAHCNFHLRGEEANRDERHAYAIAKKFGVEIHVKHFDIAAYVQQYHVSIEMACRELRYRWFEELRQDCGAQVIAVAHHRDDNIETMFLNLLRGTGIAGMAGMKLRNGYVVRPMLDVTRHEIEEYLADHKINYVTDSTNLSNDFKRNRIRNALLPAIYDMFPGADELIAKTISCLRENVVIYNEAIKEASERYRNGNVVNLSAMLSEYPAPATLLFEMLHPIGFSMSQVKSMIASAIESGRQFFALDYVVTLDRGQLFITDKSPTDEEQEEYEVSLAASIDSPIKLCIRNIAIGQFTPQKDGSTIYLDSSVLDGNPRFTLRRWRKGDRMAPYGMHGTKKISDIFSDSKISVVEKSHIWILTRNNEILWVVGIRTSRHFPITKATKRIIEISINRQ